MKDLEKYVKEYHEQIRTNMIKEHLENRKEVLNEISETDRMLIAILKGNLILENKLKDLLVKYGIKRSMLDKKYQSFHDKLNLCNNLNIINEDTVNYLSKMNTTRNKYGHNINFKITEEYLEGMISTLNARDKSFYEGLLDIHGYKNLEGDEKIYFHVLTFIEVLYFDLNSTKSMLFHKKYNIMLGFYNDILTEINDYNEKHK